MKHGKRLTLRQKKFLVSQGLDPDKYLFSKQDAESYIFIDKKTGKSMLVRR